ncbi:MAG: lipid-A-disaccharide synthase [Bacteroidetes bacterium]|nr:lipid-A-disaccharide synthase [Bacteroidota bacterium]
MKKTLLIIAGETSGDKHAALLVESMKKKDDVRLIGIGGDRMQSAGVELLHHVREMSVMGFSEVLSKLLFFRKVRQDLFNAIASEKPAAVILVDYPGFNLRFAESAKKMGMKVIYFISPQVWAWGKGRIKKIRRTVDLMLTVFKFEEEMYKRENVNAHFVGHPLIDEMKPHSDSEVLDFRRRFTTAADGKILALLPGSRLQEINRIFPTMLESVKLLSGELRQSGVTLETVVGCAPGIDESVYGEFVRRSGITVHLTRDVDLLMSSADSAMVTSGTATLEAALHELPMLVVYKTSTLNYLIGRSLVKLNAISLVNIVGQKDIVKELVQDKFKPLVAASIVKDLLINNGVASEIRERYRDLKKILGGSGASDRAADLILKLIQ